MSTTSNPFSAAQAMAAFNQMNASNPFGTRSQQLLSQGLTKEQANQQSAQAFSAAVQAANPQLDFSKRNLNSLTMDRDIYQQAEDYYRRYGTGMPQVPRGSVGVDPVTGQIRFDNPVSAPIAPQRIGNEPTEQQENPNSAAAQLAALSSANMSPTGSMFASPQQANQPYSVLYSESLAKPEFVNHLNNMSAAAQSAATATPTGSMFASQSVPNFAQLFTANPTYENFMGLNQRFNQITNTFGQGNSPFSLQDIQEAASAFQQAIQPYAQQFQEQSGQEVLARRAAGQQQQLRTNPFAQQAPAIPLTPSPTALARMGSTANTRQAFTAPQTAAPAQVPTLGGFGQMPNLSQMLGTASQTPMTGSAFGQAGGAFPSTPGNYGGGASGGMALEGRYGIASGNSTPFPIQGNVSVVKLAQGGDVSKARQMLQNLQNPVQRFADGGPTFKTEDLVAQAVKNIQSGAFQDLEDINRAAEQLRKAGNVITDEQVQAAYSAGKRAQDEAIASFIASTTSNPMDRTNPRGSSAAEALDLMKTAYPGITQEEIAASDPYKALSAASQYALFHTGLGGEGAPGAVAGGIGGMDVNIRARVEDAARQAQAGTLTKAQVEDFISSNIGQGKDFSEQDLIRATGKTSAQLLAEMQFKQPVDTKPPVVILPPTEPLPDLTEEFVAPTAPPPEAPPAALTPGQEGLDPGTAIVGKIPESERVAIPQLDTEFRASEPRTPTYDRFGRVTGYNYSPAAKLTPATGTNVFNWTPPGITSRPRSLLNIGDVPGVMVDPVTGQMRLPLSASQQFARDRSTLDNQFRQLYARAAAGDKSLPAQAPASAAAAFRNFVMSGEDPMLQNKLRFRDIEQQKYDPTKADPALRAQYGQSAFVSDLAAAFDPFLARNRAALTALAEQQTPKSYSEMYPDIAAAYAKLKPEDKAKFPTLRDYELYHFDTYGRKEGRTSPLLGMGALQSPYAATFFSKGGEASTEDFIKKQSGGDVSRETTSPETRGATSVDEREEVRSEVQRMLKRAETLKSSRQEEEKSLGEKTIEAGLRLYDRFSDRAKMPVNQRVFLETVLDKSKEPITEASFSKKELDTLKSIILDRYKKIEPALDSYEKYLTEKLAGSNTKKRGTGFDKGVLYPEARKTYEKDLDAIRSYRQGTLTPEFVELADTTQNLRSRKMPYYRHYAFEDISVSGPDLFDKLNVSPVIGYDDYGIDAGKARRLFAGDDPRAALHTTLGRFRYKVDPETKGLVVVDRYDFNPPTAGHGGPSLPYRAAPGFLQVVTYPVEGAEPGGSSVGYDLVRTYAGRAAPEGSGRDVRIQLDNKQAPVPYNKGGEVNVPRETSTSKQQLDKLAQVSQRKKA